MLVRRPCFSPSPLLNPNGAIPAGLQVFRAAAKDPAITHITVLSRRPLPDYVPASDKAQVIVLADFLDYPPEVAARLAEHDACIWSLGGSSSGHTEESYTVFTLEYVKVFVDALQRSGGVASRPENDPFRFVYVSGEGADPEEKSLLLFARIKVSASPFSEILLTDASTRITKGRAEKYLMDLPPSSGIRASIVRPGWFHPTKEDEHLRSATARTLHTLFAPIIKGVWPSAYTPVEAIGQLTVEIAKGRWSEEQLFRNVRLRELMVPAPTKRYDS